MEQWKEVDWIDGYKGAMLVSDTGRVQRTAYQYKSRGGVLTSKPAKQLSPYIGNHGYPEIAIQINGKRKKFSVHRLVARAFVEGYAPDLTVNHIDGNKTNNNASNLEWVTLSRNTQHQWEIGLVDLRGDNNPQRKLSSGKVRIIRDLIKLGATPNQLGVLLDLSPSLIYMIRDGVRWNHLTD